jgi:hypothetical protein
MVIQQEKSAFWEVIISVIVGKNSYKDVSNSERMPR